MHNLSMSDPGTYEHAVEMFDDMSAETKKRLVRDSRGTYHTIKQSIYILSDFDRLTGLKWNKEGDPFRPSFNKSREIMDEAVKQSEQSGLPLDTCFQMVVMKLDHERLDAEVRKEEEERRAKE